jgi:hypothetical protein
MSAFGYTRYGQKFGAAVRAAGVRLSDYHLSATDRLASELFELGGCHGLETNFTFLYPFIGGTQVSHSFNLADPSRNRIQTFTSVTHDANGITGNPGMVTLFPFESGSVADAECSYGVYQRSGVSSDQNDMLMYLSSGPVIHGINCRQSTYGNAVFFGGVGNATGYISVATPNPQGFYTAMRLLQYFYGYKNGVNLGGLTTGAAGNSETFYLLGNSTHNIAFCYLTRNFTQSGFAFNHEMNASFYSIVQKFQNTIGRAV